MPNRSTNKPKQDSERDRKRKGAAGRDQPGPRPDTLRVEGDWTDAVKRALEKEPPATGLPERQTKKRKKRKKHRPSVG